MAKPAFPGCRPLSSLIGQYYSTSRAKTGLWWASTVLKCFGGPGDQIGIAKRECETSGDRVAVHDFVQRNRESGDSGSLSDL